MTSACPACGAPAAEPFVTLAGLPVHGTAVLDTPDAARAVAVGDQDLCLCACCGLVFNRVFDPGLLDYTGAHEESQHHSARFAEYAATVSAEWVARHGLTGQRLVEIGCGAGDFAVELLAAGAGRVTGIDPHFGPERVPAHLAERLVALPKFFAASQVEPGTAAIVCRHTFEHVPALAEFGAEIVAARVPTLLAEVPDLGRILAEGAFWDLQYEHCSYFTPATLAAYLHRIGFGSVEARLTYDDQYVVAEATLREGPRPAVDIAALETACAAFAASVRRQVQTWGAWLDERGAAGDPVVVWGGGAKGLTFLNVLAAHADPVAAVVDINPGLQGHFMAGLGLPIVAPADLASAPPRAAVLMNPVYRAEVRAMLDELGLGATELHTL